MRVGSWSLLLAATSLAGAQQVRLSVASAGVSLGTASVTQKLGADGRKTVLLRMDLTSQGTTVQVRTESVYSADGTPLRIFHESIVGKPPKRRQVTVTFEPQAARAVVDEGGKRTVKLVELVANAPLEHRAEFWFLRDQPKPGTSVQAYGFDVASLEWRLNTTTYVGPTSYTLGGKPIPAHRLTHSRGEAIVDNQGMPLRVVADNVVMTRMSGS